MTSQILLEKPKEKLDFSLSVSKIKTFKDCAAKYNFSYILKLPKLEWPHFSFGSFLHEILENFQKNIKEGSQDPFHILMTNCFRESYKIWKPKLTEDQKNEAWEICSTYLKQITEQKKNNTLPKIIDTEKEFYINIDDKVLVNGFIDVVQMDFDNVLHIADYKTTKNKKYVTNDYFQLLTYAFVMCLENPELEKVRAGYILLRHDFEEVVKEYNRKDILKAEKIFLDYADTMQKETEFKPKPSFLCSYCDFKDHCPEGSEFINKINGKHAKDNNIKYGKSSW